MIRKAEYHSHPSPARVAGGGGDAAASATDTSTVMFAICLTRGVRSETTASPVCRVHAQAYVKLLQNGNIRYHTESDPSNVGLPCASYYNSAAHVLRYTTTLPAAVASALATAAAVTYELRLSILLLLFSLLVATTMAAAAAAACCSIQIILYYFLLFIR